MQGHSTSEAHRQLHFQSNHRSWSALTVSFHTDSRYKAQSKKEESAPAINRKVCVKLEYELQSMWSCAVQLQDKE